MPFESVGRRPVLIGTLFMFSGASIGLVFTRRFVTLIILRSIQGGGSATLTAIGKSRELIVLTAFILTKFPRSLNHRRHFNSRRKGALNGNF